MMPRVMAIAYSRPGQWSRGLSRSRRHDVLTVHPPEPESEAAPHRVFSTGWAIYDVDWSRQFTLAVVFSAYGPLWHNFTKSQGFDQRY